jgi:hypothetical protein
VQMLAILLAFESRSEIWKDEQWERLLAVESRLEFVRDWRLGEMLVFEKRSAWSSAFLWEKMSDF